MREFTCRLYSVAWNTKPHRGMLNQWSPKQSRDKDLHRRQSKSQVAAVWMNYLLVKLNPTIVTPRIPTKHVLMEK